MEINRADVAELVDARDLKFPATAETTAIFCKTAENTPAASATHPRILQNISEADLVAFASEPMTRGQAREPVRHGRRPPARLRQISRLPARLMFRFTRVRSAPPTLILKGNATTRN
jgi:hypothetical protein